jgi:hypothetical protein
MKLGKLAARHDKRVPMMAKYMQDLPPAPSSCTWSTKLTNPGMMVNDMLGDCTCAGIGHAIQVWTANAKDTQVTLSDVDIVNLYSTVTGYQMGNPSTDRGGNENDILTYWLNNPISGNILSAYTSVEPNNQQAIQDAIYWFGGVYIGLGLPLSAKMQDVWQIPPGGAIGEGSPASWGGHCVYVCDYDDRGLTCITWGQLKKMTWQFWQTYCDEAYALLSPDWIAATGIAPDGLPVTQLQADMAELKSL